MKRHIISRILVLIILEIAVIIFLKSYDYKSLNHLRVQLSNVLVVTYSFVTVALFAFYLSVDALLQIRKKNLSKAKFNMVCSLVLFSATIYHQNVFNGYSGISINILSLP